VQKVSNPTRERIDTTRDFGDLTLCDEETFDDDIPDVALEIAAGKYWEAGNPFTLAFCSGLDTCPSSRP
jgi:hypothetical protein